MKQAISAIALTILWSQSAWAEDVRNKEILIVDQGCVERKVADCVADSLQVSKPKSEACPEGSDTSDKPHTYPTFRFCKFNNPASLVNYTLTQSSGISAIEAALPKCKMLAENFPSGYGSESCLKPLAQERLINAVNVELKRLTPGQCTGSKCDELDKVPAQ